MVGEEEEAHPAAWRPLILAAGLSLWLAGMWFWSDVARHRMALWVLVLPSVLLNGRALLQVLREERRWAGLVAALLVYQWLSRFWSAPAVAAPGYWVDVLMTGTFLAGVLALSRSTIGIRWFVPSLGMVAALVGLLSLLVFYGDPDHSIAVDRLRIVLVYEDGLNAVLTGLLCSFGGLVMLWQTCREEHKGWRGVWLVALTVLVFGILASQSRGAMLAFGLGFAVLLVVERKKILPGFAACAVTTLTFFAVLYWVQSGDEAARDLLGRGATGRSEIYAWFFKQMSGLDGVIGKGMGVAATIPEEELGWYVHHPHSVYLTQYFLTGAIGTGLFLLTLMLAMQAALKLAKGGEPLWLALLAGFSVSLVFDGSYVFSMHSIGRVEPLLLLLPAAIAVGRAGRKEKSKAFQVLPEGGEVCA